ncbi:hypothetical protein SLA2020_495230 [Shorea laevis]
MQVREAIKIFSSPQEIDLLGRSVKKIKGADSEQSLGRAPKMEAIVQQDKSNTSNEGAAATVTMVDVDHTNNEGEAQNDTNMTEGDGNLEFRVPLSYKDKLTGSENPVAISFSTIPAYMDEESDEDDDPNDDSPVVLLSKAEKQRIRAPWMNALIVKAFCHKPLGYNFIFPRLKAQWKPTGHWDFIDLGLDFYLVRFQVEEDLHRVIFGGPWFVGPYFMTMRRWEPHFVPSEALHSFTTTAVWAQLPNLSADYYDPSTLQKIGNKVGNLLRVDAHTAHHTRGQYARVCVQIDLSKPVVKYVRIGRQKQKVLYEGVNALCFSCGRIGHRNSQCTQKGSPPTGVNALTPPSSQCVNQVAKEGQPSRTEPSSFALEPTNMNSVQQDCSNTKMELSDREEFGPWLLVERRRPRKKTTQTQEQSVKSPPARNEARGSGSGNQKIGSKQQSGPTGATPNGSISTSLNADRSSLNADQIVIGSSSTVIKNPTRSNSNDHKSNLKSHARGSGEGLQYARKGSRASMSARTGSNSKMPIQSSLVNEGPSNSLNSSPNEPMVDKPTFMNDPNVKTIEVANKAHKSTSSMSIVMSAENPHSSSSPITPLLPSSTPPNSVDLTHGTPIPPIGPQSRSFLDIQWKCPATGVGVEPDSSNVTAASLLLERLPNSSSVETTNTHPQESKPPSSSTISTTTTGSSCKELGSLLRVGSKLQRKRRTNRKDSHPYQAPTTNLPSSEETLLLYPDQGTNEACSSPCSTQAIVSGDMGNGLQAVTDSVPLSGDTDGNIAGGGVASNSG